MTYLLDTGVWLWSLFEPLRLSRPAREAIADLRHDLFLSAVTSWEITIKAEAGKLKLPEPPGTYIPKRIADQGLRPLPVSHAHAVAVYDLPPHHRNPFDRLLIAQAMLEGMTLITADRMFTKYPATLFWAGH